MFTFRFYSPFRFYSLWRAAAFAGLVLVLNAACSSTKEKPRRIPQLDEQSKAIAEALPSRAAVKPLKPRKILIFSRCEGYAHEVIPMANKAFGLMGRMTGAFEPVFSSDMNAFAPQNLKKFDAILFNNTTRLKFNSPDFRKALMDFVQDGKGIIGVHAATDNFYDWPAASEMLGGIFDGHPWGAGGTWAIKIDEPDHPLNKAFDGKAFLIKDEIYQIAGSYSREENRVLLSLDMSSPRNRQVEGIKRADNDFAVSWIRRCGNGRVFYCSLGHNPEVFLNRAVLCHYLDGIQYALGDLKVDDRPSAALDRPPTPALATDPGGVDDPFTAVRRYDFGSSRVPLAMLEAAMRAAAPGQPTKIEGKLLEILADPGATFAGRQFVCRMMRLAGSERSIPVLADLLYDKELHDAARFALEGMASSEVDLVFRKALELLDGDALIGLIGSIARRGDRQAVKTIGPWIGGDDPALAAAAISALGQIGGEEAVQALTATPEPFALEALRDDALLECADRLLADGNPAEALVIYDAMTVEGKPIPIRTAAWRGVVLIKKEEALEDLIALLTKDGPKMRQAAAGLLGDLPKGADLAPLLDTLPSFSPKAKVLVLGALAFRGDRSAAPAVIKTMDSIEMDVRVAAVEALGVLGGPEQVELLARMAATEGAVAKAAAKSLQRLYGEDVDAALLENVAEREGPVRAALIRAMSDRQTDGALPVYLEYAADPDESVRGESLKALERLAGEEEIPALLNHLAILDQEGGREAVEQAIHSTCKRIDNEIWSTGLLIGVLDGADGKTRASLVHILGRLPGDASLEALYGAPGDAETAVGIAAAAGLAQWPDPRPMQHLLEVADSSEDQELRRVALKGYFRMAALPDDRRVEEIQTVYETALPVVQTTEEKRLLLDGLAEVVELWVLEFVAPFLDDEALKEQAQSVYDRVAAAYSKTVPHAAEGCPVTLAFPFVEKYSAGGPNALTDGKFGSGDHGDGRWQGFEGKNIVATVDLGRELQVESIRVGFLENNNSWIFLPLEVEFLVSTDGQNYETVADFKESAPDRMREGATRDYYTKVDHLPVRYVQVRAQNIGICPEWHPGNGGAAWLFADEIQVNPQFKTGQQ